MSKKLYFLISFVLVLGLSGAAQATAIDDCRYNLSFELLIDPNDANGCGNRVCGHTSDMDDVLAWEMSASFAGVDVNVGHETCGDSRDWCIYPDGNAMAYMQSGKYIYQVLDPTFDGNAIITVGKKYILTFDAAVNDESPYNMVYSIFYGDNPDANQIIGDTVVLVAVPHPSGKTDWFYDLTLAFVAKAGPSIGEKLGIKFEAPRPNTWLFVEDVRLDWSWATSAYSPSPADGAEDVARDVNLTWEPGLLADRHIVYFSTDAAKVSTRHQDANQGIQDVNIFDPTLGGGQLVLGETYYWAIDEVNQAFSPTPGIPAPPWLGDVWSFEVAGFATNPDPEDEAEDVPLYSTDLSWTPGTDVNDVNGHDVYFGTSESEVTDANIDVNFGVYMGRQDANDFNDFVPALELGKTYYWRIDEVNETAGTLIKGKLWSFTVVNYLVVDDMDSYADKDAIRAVWTQSNGAELFVSFGKTDANLVRDGNSMMFAYMNFTVVDGNYVGSEAVASIADLEIGSDWTAGSVKALALYFYGNLINGTDHDSGYVYHISQDQMYVAVDDGTNVGIVKYPDMNDIKFAEWHEWNIELADPCLAAVDMNNIAKVYIGFGGTEKTGQSVEGAGGDAYGSGKHDTVWFDDIRLYPPRCVPEYSYLTGSYRYINRLTISDWYINQAAGRPEMEADGTFVSDCKNDYFDLWSMGTDWLASSYGNATATTPSDTNLMGHWTMDDSDAQMQVDDSSVNANHGTLYDEDRSPGRSTTKHSTEGAIGTALTFDGFDDYVEIPALDLNSNTVTVSAWMKRDGDLGAGGSYPPIVSVNEPNKYIDKFILGIGSKGDYGEDDEWGANNELCYHWTGFSWDFHPELYVPDKVWSFVAVVVEPNKGTLYLYDGLSMKSSVNREDHAPMAFDKEIYFAYAWDSNEMTPIEDRPHWFKGAIDDVYIYNRALSPEEILGLAGLSGEHYLALEPWRADANGDDKVDVKDYVIMAKNWLKEVLWPFE